MKLSVTCGEGTVEYYLTRKKVKNINLRIKPDGTVNVSAPKSVPLSCIEDYIRRKYAFITDALEKLKSRPASAEPDLDALHSEGDIFLYLGESYALKITSGSEDRVFTDGGSLVAEISGETDARYITKLIRNWYYNRTVELFRRLNEETFRLFSEKYDLPKAKVNIKILRSMWGECYIRQSTILMNSRLIFYPEEAVRSVFVHEYAHFLVPDHSKKFYAVVLDIMPDYKYWHGKLK